jgi:hypothetical protein
MKLYSSISPRRRKTATTTIVRSGQQQLFPLPSHLRSQGSSHCRGRWDGDRRTLTSTIFTTTTSRRLQRRRWWRSKTRCTWHCGPISSRRGQEKKKEITLCSLFSYVCSIPCSTRSYATVNKSFFWFVATLLYIGIQTSNMYCHKLKIASSSYVVTSHNMTTRHHNIWRT